MKRIFLLIALVAFGITLYADDGPKRVILPGKGKLDIERFNKARTLQHDVTK